METKPLEQLCKDCRGFCCTAAPFAKHEFEKVKRDGKSAFIKPIGNGSMLVMKSRLDMTCFFLENGRCTIYSRRPKICRELGTVYKCSRQMTATEIANYLLNV